jgi:hypothetical protein
VFTADATVELWDNTEFAWQRHIIEIELGVDTHDSLIAKVPGVDMKKVKKGELLIGRWKQKRGKFEVDKPTAYVRAGLYRVIDDIGRRIGTRP